MIDIESLYNNPSSIQKELSERFIVQRKQRKLSRKELSRISGVPYASIVRFETLGEISLSSFVKLVCSVGLAEELNTLLSRKYYKSIEEIIDEESHKN